MMVHAGVAPKGYTTRAGRRPRDPTLCRAVSVYAPDQLSQNACSERMFRTFVSNACLYAQRGLVLANARAVVLPAPAPFVIFKRREPASLSRRRVPIIFVAHRLERPALTRERHAARSLAAGSWQREASSAELERYGQREASEEAKRRVA
jgi:hypothetical protein